MTLIDKINLISEEAKGHFKPDLKKYGKNFRAISESAVLDVLNPLLKKYQIAYEVIIKKSELRIEKINAGRDQAGNLIEKLVFVAEVVVRLVITDLTITIDFPVIRSSDPKELGKNEPITFNQTTTMEFEGYGTGIDSGDKASGKALTAAVKYALFKGFRLQYSDDPDAEASEDIENIVPEEAKIKNCVEKMHKNEKMGEKEPLASKAQLDFIKGLAKDSNLTDEEFKKQFGFLPYDEKMPMRKAREIISKLQELPF